MTASPEGRIITFYSYKGGTGRSMAMSNVAWVLASHGKRVLAIDWDLEAPGLHRYFEPFLIDPELYASDGIIDFVWEASAAAMTPADGDESTPSEVELPELDDYTVRLDLDFPGEGVLDLIPAGCQGGSYAERVNGFDWDNFYERLGGGRMLQAARARLREQYDFILIDSRTGVSDTSGICTIHLPDSLVLLFTLNNQSTRGAAAVAESVRAQRPEMPIFPVPTRVEPFEHQKLSDRLRQVKSLFAPYVSHLDHRQRDEYWGAVEIPYVPFYAYEEVLAPLVDERGRKSTVLAATLQLAAHISGEHPEAMESACDEVRRRVLAKGAGAETVLLGSPVGSAASSSAPVAATAAAPASTAGWAPPPHATERTGASAPSARSRWSAGLGTRLAAVALPVLVLGSIWYAFAGRGAGGSSLGGSEDHLAALTSASTPATLRREYLLELFNEQPREFVGLDLSGVDLSGQSLEGIRLPNANLRRAKLIGTALDSADLSGAQLDSADLTGATLQGANLSGATMTGAVLNGANFFTADLSNVALDSTITNARTVLSDSTMGPFRRDEDIGVQDVQPAGAPVTSGNMGWIWIGNYDRQRGQWEKVQIADASLRPVSTDPALLSAKEPFTVRGNMTLRQTAPLPDAAYFRGVAALGVIPRGSVVTLLEPPRSFERNGIMQFWARVEAGTLRQ